MHECTYCNEELSYEEEYGLLCAHQSGEVIGHIYKCNNDDCEYQSSFYVNLDDGELCEGYPC